MPPTSRTPGPGARNATATTQSRPLTTQEKRERNRQLQEESRSWRLKYKKAFPTFVFFFDQVDTVTEHNLRIGIERQGGTIEPFFGKRVTNVVTSRAIPAANNKENLGRSPAVSTSKSASSTSHTGPIRTNKRSANNKAPSRPYLSADGQKLRHDGVSEKFDSQDILTKALEFGIKVWRVDKLQAILDRLDSNSPSKPPPAHKKKASLPTLLREEQLYGTRERDPFQPRADTYYFPSDSYYLLVEDSTTQHRPIVVKEYERQPKGTDPLWPILWGGVEGRSGFYHYTGPRITYVPPPPPAPQKPTSAATKVMPAVAARALAPGLRRAVSLKNMTKPGAGAAARAAVPEAMGQPGSYVAVSGNSMPITSNIATTSTAIHPVHHGGSAPKGASLLSAAHRQVTFGGGRKNGLLAPPGVHMQGKLKRSASVDAGLNSRAPPPREEPKKPGYCENCRVKYDDFKEHIVHRKHRKFAMDPENWRDLDELLSRVSRPPRYIESDEEEEEEDEVDDQEMAESEAGSSVEGDSGFFDQEDACDDEDVDDAEEPMTDE